MARLRDRLPVRARSYAIGFSVLVHVAILIAIFSARPPAFGPPDPRPIAVSLVDPVRIQDPPTPQPTVKPAAAKAVARQDTPHPVHAARIIRSAQPSAIQTPAPSAELTGAQIAGASGAGSGGGGGGCDMALRLQSALRRDPLVQAAIRGSAGKAIMVWNGDWVQNGAEDGKGLAAVREAIMWEIAFAPAACRAEPVHGLVLISPNEEPGSLRLALGQGEWRWSNLLALR